MYLLLCLLGTSYSKADDGNSFTTALYGNGPGYQMVNNTRPDMNNTISSKFYGFNRFTLECRSEVSAYSLVAYSSTNSDLKIQTPHLVVICVTANTGTHERYMYFIQIINVLSLLKLFQMYDFLSL